MEILVGDPINSTFPWQTADGKYIGVLMAGMKLTAVGDGEDLELPAGALLCVPKHSPNEPPSINKYSPLIAQAPTVEELKPKMEAWLRKNARKTLWELRAR